MGGFRYESVGNEPSELTVSHKDINSSFKLRYCSTKILIIFSIARKSQTDLEAA